MRLFSIPNLLTCLNLLCGIGAIIAVFHRDIVTTMILVAISLVADFLDGFVARLMKISSPIGKELDSLADMVTFGVVPAVTMVFLLGQIYQYESSKEIPYPAYIGLMIGVFSALRLAKFNLDERQSDCFYGLATPANTLFILSLWIVKHYHPNAFITQVFTHPIALFVIVPISCIMLIADIKLIAFKFKNMTWKDNQWKYILLIACVLLLLIFRIQALPLLVPVYIGISLISEQFKNKNV